eukprot:6202400-Pleurochrysis_carterae.AAC.1
MHARESHAKCSWPLLDVSAHFGAATAVPSTCAVLGVVRSVAGAVFVAETADTRRRSKCDARAWRRDVVVVCTESFRCVLGRRKAAIALAHLVSGRARLHPQPQELFTVLLCPGKVPNSACIVSRTARRLICNLRSGAGPLKTALRVHQACHRSQRAQGEP